MVNIMKILVISNLKDTLYCITKTLPKSRITSSKSTDEAIMLLKQQVDFDLIFLEDSLTKSEIIEFFVSLNNINKQPIFRTLYLSDFSEIEFLEQITKLGCSGVISKCFDSTRFLEEIKPHIEIVKLKKQLERNLSHQHTLFKTVYQQSPIGIVIGNKQKINGKWEGIFLDFNQSLLNITMYEKDYLSQYGWERITHPEDVEKNRELYQAFYDDKIDRFSIEKRYIRKDGEIIWVLMDVTTLDTEESSSTFLCLIQDITERKFIQESLIESARSKSVLLSNLPGMAYRCEIDQDWTMRFVSSGCYDLTGYKPSELIDNNVVSYNEIIASEYRGFLWKRWQKIIDDHDSFEHEYEIICADMSRKWVLEKGEVIYDQNHQAIALEGIIFDITRRKKYEEKLKYLSEHDYLTGLYNREYLATVLKNNQSIDKNALMIINFNRVNSLSLSYGFSFSEQIMKELSKIIVGALNNKFSLYQVSFERFAIYIENYLNQKALVQLAKQIIDACMNIDITKLIGCNIGILQIDTCDKECDVEQMIKNASIASEQHYKQMTSINFFTKDLSISTKREADIKNALIQTIDNQDDHFYLNFQPIIDPYLKKVVGFEALSRFKIDGLGQIPPSEFIPLAEETQVILALGDIIFEKACLFKQACNQAGYPDIQISINVSTLQLLKDGFASNFLELFSKYNINLKTVELEVTESMFSDNFIYLNEKLQTLRKHGVRIAIDDFGTGYSSFSRERELNVDTIKIDKQFIDRIFMLDDDQLVTSDIIMMAHKLGYRTIAEGVENKRQYDYLCKHTCDYIQGYYFAKPLSLEAALDYLKKQNG